MSATCPWIAFVDGILNALGASDAYRAKAVANIEAMIQLGLLEQAPVCSSKARIEQGCCLV